MNTEEQHTPGPWIYETDEKAATIAILGKHGDTMRNRDFDGFGRILTIECAEELDDRPFAPRLPEQEANARLIAAAPDLLAALIELHALGSLILPQRRDEALRNAAAAIAKAKGQVP